MQGYKLNAICTITAVYYDVLCTYWRRWLAAYIAG